MTPEQMDAVEALSATLKADLNEVHIEEDEYADGLVHVTYKKKRGSWYGCITIMPDGRREFGRR